MQIPRNVFRCGEETITQRFVLEAGAHHIYCDTVQTTPHKETFDVHSVSWEVYASNDEDLDEVLWSVNLGWKFSCAKIPIAPLSFFGGSVEKLIEDSMNRPTYSPASELERLGELAREEEFAAELNSYRLGQKRLYRGQMIYRQYPVSLPGNVEWGLTLSSDEPVVLSNKVRVKVILSGAMKSWLEVA